MRMGEHKRVNARRIERKVPIVEFFLSLRSLEHPAIDEDARMLALQHEAGAGNNMAGSMEAQAHAGLLRFVWTFAG